MEEGLSADAAGDDEKAAELFVRSLELHPSYDVAGNLGLVEYGLERYAAAANHLSYCLSHFASGQKRELRELIERKLESARTYVGELQIRVAEPGVELRLDGSAVTSAEPEQDKIVFVDVGQHEVVAQKGERTATRTVSVMAGQVIELSLILPAEPTTAEHFGKYEAAGSPGPSWVPAYVLGGVTVATLVTSLVFRGMANSELDKMNDLRTGLPASSCGGMAPDAVCTELLQAEGRYNTRATVADVSLVSSVALAGATAGYVICVLVARKKSAESAVTVIPVFDGRLGQVLLRGKF